ncbi:hypothetical protein CDO73_15405 [Saccharibacillus sp. O23]|uniref:response regulator n=1 Tax=Saccharibacillus sp. O23 TaxID=2009338 RepID=UPI000B4E25AB|nr:response regulator [Saccharibacillus sp. O23]OWR29568.1 hypothetical protein CDO73_15405 [Saccharibacillus sp. O23]
MKILIVDDEPRHRRGMMNLILSFRPGDRLNAAGDGEAALALIREERPDLVLTDIRMPNMDGLEFLKRVEEERPKPRVVMVSAYNLFDYAQQALRHGASDYLLKPVDENKLAAMLDRIEEEISAEERRKREEDERDLRLARTQSVYRSRLFAEWIGGSLAPEEMRELERTEGLGEAGLVIFTELDVREERRGAFDVERFLRESERAWSPIGQAFSFAAEAYPGKNLQTVTIVRGSCLLLPEQRQAIRACGERLRAGWTEYGRMFHGVGPACATLGAEGPEAFRLAREAGTHGIRESLSGMVFHDELRTREAPQAAERRPKPGSGDGGDADALVRDCLAWIEERLHEELTLERAAERFFFNPSYFSTWIKQQTGDTFTSHLTKARMRRARALLEAGRRIGETAEACGYPDTKYFCRVFKKMHGISPAAYKRGPKSGRTAE